jgi:uncharacterized protein (TIGR04255 family)
MTPAGAFRLLSRDRTDAVTVTQGRLSVETTHYTRWEEFRDGLIAQALRAVGEELGAITGLDRVGLRYIDEIRVPGEAGPADRWTRYIDQDVLAPLRLARGHEFKAFQAALQLDTAENCELQMRYGTLDGHIVADSGPLRLPTAPTTGQCFFIDIDSYWTRPGDLEEFDLVKALSIANQLHDPIGELFERAITEDLRNDVFRSAI